MFKIKTLSILSALLLAIFVLQCSNINTNTIQHKILQRNEIMSATVFIENAGISCGSGFCIAKETEENNCVVYVLTCYHVVRPHFEQIQNSLTVEFNIYNELTQRIFNKQRTRRKDNIQRACAGAFKENYENFFKRIFKNRL